LNFSLLAKLPAPRGEQLSKPKLNIPKLGLGNEEKLKDLNFSMLAKPLLREASSLASQNSTFPSWGLGMRKN